MANRVVPDESTPPDVAASASPNRGGWAIGDISLTDASGRTKCLVWGFNGENLIRAEFATQVEGWGRAAAQARPPGMLGRSASGWGGRTLIVPGRFAWPRQQTSKDLAAADSPQPGQPLGDPVGTGHR